VTSEARIETPRASVYMKQLCRHFAHKVDASFDDERGRIAFSAGVCRLEAAGGVLVLAADADDEESLRRVEDVVASHLERFAFRDDLKVAWGAPA
jgi:hypothetical protein